MRVALKKETKMVPLPPILGGVTVFAGNHRAKHEAEESTLKGQKYIRAEDRRENQDSARTQQDTG